MLSKKVQSIIDTNIETKTNYQDYDAKIFKASPLFDKLFKNYWWYSKYSLENVIEQNNQPVVGLLQDDSETHHYLVNLRSNYQMKEEDFIKIAKKISDFDYSFISVEVFHSSISGTSYSLATSNLENMVIPMVERQYETIVLPLRVAKESQIQHIFLVIPNFKSQQFNQVILFSDNVLTEDRIFFVNLAESILKEVKSIISPSEGEKEVSGTEDIKPNIDFIEPFRFPKTKTYLLFETGLFLLKNMTNSNIITLTIQNELSIADIAFIRFVSSDIEKSIKLLNSHSHSDEVKEWKDNEELSSKVKRIIKNVFPEELVCSFFHTSHYTMIETIKNQDLKDDLKITGKASIAKITPVIAQVMKTKKIENLSDLILEDLEEALTSIVLTEKLSEKHRNPQLANAIKDKQIDSVKKVCQILDPLIKQIFADNQDKMNDGYLEDLLKNKELRKEVVCSLIPLIPQKRSFYQEKSFLSWKDKIKETLFCCRRRSNIDYLSYNDQDIPIEHMNKKWVDVIKQQKSGEKVINLDYQNNFSSEENLTSEITFRR